jgi:hypothetical protein
MRRSRVQEIAERKPMLLEVGAFIIFGLIVTALLWSMYRNTGLHRYSPPPLPDAKVAPKPAPPSPPPSPPTNKKAAEAPHTVAPEKVSFKLPNGMFKRNPDGTLSSKDGKATVKLWEANNTDIKTAAVDTAKAHPNWKVTYGKKGPHYFVVSGYDGDNIFYQKTQIFGDHSSSFLMQYPKAEKAKYRAANEMLESSFRRLH